MMPGARHILMMQDLPIPRTTRLQALCAGHGRDAHGHGFTAMGFRVPSLRDGARRQIQDQLARAARALQGRQGVGLPDCAGHGLQVDWRNFTMPVDAAPGTISMKVTAGDAQRGAFNQRRIVTDPLGT
jgi:uncharacterized caspase-like protein